MTTSDTEKQDKRLANRRLRRRVRAILLAEPDAVLPALREVSCVWCFDKDGKRRFAPHEHPDWMRK